MSEATVPPPDAETVLGFDPRALLGRAVLRPEGRAVGGQRVGDYELIERIAEGGMGVVYRARQISLGRIVALKMIRSGLLATPVEVQRFHREAEAVASLDHPHIVPVYEIGEDEERHFFSMKLIEGGSLAELNAECGAARRLSAEWMRRAAEIVAHMACALHHAHQRGVLHRDVKPTNVLLDEHGTPHRTDFGLAKLTEGGAGMTMSLAVMGTPHYMSPEQAAGDNARVTFAADIYSLGAVLYELLSGHPPFEGGTTLDLLRQVQERTPDPVRRANPGIARDLETICLKCLQKAPADRYASAEELAADLERWLAGKPVHARPVSAARRLWLWSRRNPAAAIAGVLLLMLAAVASVAAVRLRGQRDEINEGLARSLLAQAYAQRLGTGPERRPQNLRVLAEAALIRPSLELRNEVIATLALPALGPPQTWHTGERQLHNHQRMLSADGERYALFGQSQGVTVYQRREGTVLAGLITPPGHLFIGFLSPGGRFFINYDQAHSVFVWDLSLEPGGPMPHSHVLPGPWGYYGDFTPDSRALALSGKDNSVHFFDLESGAERMNVPLPCQATRLAIAPGGDRFVSTTGGMLHVWALSPAGEIGKHQHHSVITALAWHPHGRFVAAGYQNGEMQLFDSVSGTSRWLTPHHQYVDSLTFDASGEMLASSSWDSIRRYSDIATGRVVFEIKESGGIRGTSDGEWFATFDDDGSCARHGP